MKKITLLFLFCSVCSSSYAIQCNDKSPNFVALQGEYYNLEKNINLTPIEDKQSNEFLKELKGEWEGTVVESECLGNDKSLRKRVKNSVTEATLQSSHSDKLEILIHKTDLEQRISKNDRVFLINKDNLYSYEYSEDSITVSRKFRQKNISTYSRLLEIISTLKKSNDTLTLNMDYYSNGVFVYSQIINLEKSNKYKR